MNTCLVTIEAVHNRRVQQGIEAAEELWILEEGYALRPRGGRIYRNYIQTTLEVDFGRYDSEGLSYICEILNCLPSDIYTTYPED
mgnify:CR=1 FL=1|tara:strand:+ start:1236 stop:1490 length:255 start_codon:yes stop_codon:yes gene_type:complete